MYELDMNTQVFDKDPDYTECENCKGSGYVYEVGEDGELVKEDCPECDSGWILIEY